MRKKDKDLSQFIRERSEYGIDEREASFAYWYGEYVHSPRVRRIDAFGRERILPSYARETALFMMARYAEDEWERQMVIDGFLEEYGS